MKLSNSKAKKLLKSKAAKAFFVLAGVVVLFSWFPSCGSRGFKTKDAIETHPTRDGHRTAVPINVSEENDYITNVSFKIDETQDPAEAEVSLIYKRDGNIEINLKGPFGANNDPLKASVTNEEHSESVSGSLSCVNESCPYPITIEITYKDSNAQEHTVQFQSARESVVLSESEDPESATAGTEEGHIVIGPSTTVRIASDPFVSYWKSYLQSLADSGKNISPNLPPDAIETRYDGDDGVFMKISENAPTDTFARPINMRLSKTVTVEGNDLEILGILLNGEKLVENEQHCVVWSKDTNSDGTPIVSEDQRYTSSLLNAILLFAANKLKVINNDDDTTECGVNVVLGQASNSSGGKLALLDGNGYRQTHQNGLDVDIAYITDANKSGLFESSVNADGNFNINDQNLGWQLLLMKHFYDTGMVNRFVTSPGMKAKLVKLATDQGLLSRHKNTLEKIYPDPSPIYLDKMQLEIICSAGSSSRGIGVTENVGCQDTSARGMNWPVEWCDDNTCQASGPQIQNDAETSETDTGDGAETDGAETSATGSTTGGWSPNLPYNAKAYVSKQTCSGGNILESTLVIDFSNSQPTEEVVTAISQNKHNFGKAYCNDETTICNQFVSNTEGVSSAGVGYDNKIIKDLTFRVAGTVTGLNFTVIPKVPITDDQGEQNEAMQFDGPVAVNFPNTTCGDAGDIGHFECTSASNPCINTPISHKCEFRYSSCDVVSLRCADGYREVTTPGSTRGGVVQIGNHSVRCVQS